MHRRLITLLFLGFSSGLPLALIGSTLQAWFAVSNIDLVSIGWLSLIGLPYVYKVIWAPVIDRITLPWLSRRRDWIILTQVCLSVMFVILGSLSPNTQLLSMMLVALLIAFFSATLDIAGDAYRVDLLPQNELSRGAALSVFGYRVAMIFSGGIALVLADQIGWSRMYYLMAVVQACSIAATLLAPPISSHSHPPSDMLEAIKQPVSELLQRERGLGFLVFILLYKLGDVFTGNNGVMTNAFLLQGMQFSLSTVGTVNKIFGAVASLSGALIGGWLVPRLGLYRSLLWFGVLQAVSNLSYLLLLTYGQSYGILVLAVSFENCSAGLAMSAVFTLMMRLCDGRYSATQFALLSAVASVGRVCLGPVAGSVATQVGWAYFFIWAFIMALPALIMLRWLSTHPLLQQKQHGTLEQGAQLELS